MKANQPKSLQEAIVYFSDPENCLNYMVAKRWPDGVVCPSCGRTDVGYLAKQRKWQCKSQHDHRQFSVKVGTIFEDSPLALEKWLPAVWMLTNCKNGISSYELSRALRVTQKTAWFMLHRIRLALQRGTFSKIGGADGGPVEADETFIGGNFRKMHKSRRDRFMGQRGPVGKAIVMGMLDRKESKVRATVVPNTTRGILQDQIRRHIEAGTSVYTDENVAYYGLTYDYVHEVVNHVDQYVRGQVHTNGIENFWSLLKRGLHGTYVAVEPFHLFRYVDEQVFRFNYRKDGERQMTDAERFDIALSQVAGKRLTFAEVTGKVGETSAF